MAIQSLGNWYNRTNQSPSVKGYRFILAITNYFLKWAEAVPFTEVKTTNLVNFIKHHVIHRFGVPKRIIHDNVLQFANQSFYRFCDKYRIQNVVSTAYNSATNGLAKAFNKTIIKILKKFISPSKCDWNEKLSECPWAYWTTTRTPIGNTPFSLVYGCETVILLEIQSVALATKMTDKDNH